MPNGKFRIHGGLSPGAPRGAANGRYRHGYWTIEAIQEREFIRLARTASDDRSTALPAALLHAKIATSGLDFTGEHGAAQREVIGRLGRD